MNHVVKFLLVCLLSLVLTGPAFASEKGSEKGSMKKNFPEAPFGSRGNKVVQDEFLKFVKKSGAVDLYDEKLDRVRNLRFVELRPIPDGSRAMFRDINTGDFVHVNFDYNSTEGINNLRIFEVEKLDAGFDINKEYSNEEVQEAMKEYVAQQSKFTGSLMLYDEGSSKMRNLELIQLLPEVRRLGIMYTSPSEFKDKDSGEILDIDVRAKNENGQVKIQNLKIRKVRKP